MFFKERETNYFFKNRCRLLLAFAFLLVFSVTIDINFAQAQTIVPRIAQLSQLKQILADETGDVLVHFSSNDSRCSICLASNSDVPKATTLFANQAGLNAKLVQVQWAPWSEFPLLLQTLPLAEPLAGMPALVMFRGGREVDRHYGWRSGAYNPYFAFLRSNAVGRGKLPAMKPTAVALTQLNCTLKEQSGDVLVHFTSPDRECVFCIPSNQDLPVHLNVLNWSGGFLRVQWSPWRGFPDALATIALSEPITSLPMLVLMREGQEVSRFSSWSLSDEQKLKEWLKLNAQ